MAANEKVKVLIFAGGAGRRMNARSLPKQFLQVYGKPVIIHTLEHFEYHDMIDEIVIVCIKNWISELKGMLNRFGIRKVTIIVPGGKTGHKSIWEGLKAMRSSTDDQDIVLIHDGVRPLITDELIEANINAVRKYGNAITCEAARESVVMSTNGVDIQQVPNRDCMYVAKAPQSFRFGEVYEAYEQAEKAGYQTIDSSPLYGIQKRHMHLLHSTRNNMKITEPADFYIYKALYEAMEAQQIYGF